MGGNACWFTVCPIGPTAIGTVGKLRYKRYQIDGARHHIDTEKSYVTCRGRKREVLMRKFGFVAAAGLIAVALGGWLSTATTARVVPPVNGGGIDTIQMMASSPKLPAEHFIDYSLVYPGNY
jgi:hypothetical protein